MLAFLQLVIVSGVIRLMIMGYDGKFDLDALWDAVYNVRQGLHGFQGAGTRPTSETGSFSWWLFRA